MLEARTIVMIPENNDLTQPDKRPLPTASVFIKYTATDEHTAPFKETDIQEFVANSVTDMKKEHVKVLMTEAKSVTTMDVDPEKRTQSVLGLRMEKTSADTFKVMVAVNAVLFLALAGVAAFLAIRKPASNGRPTRATKTQES